MKSRIVLLVSVALVVLSAALWHGPVGGAAVRYTLDTEQLVRANLEYYEMEEITPFMQRGPLTRRLWLAGEADDFQRPELKRIFSGLDSVGDVQWISDDGDDVKGAPLLPMIVEVELAGLAAFGVGLLFGYFAFHRRREPDRFNL